MTHRHIDDWRKLPGASVEIRHQGTTVCSGIVDDVTEDGKILWVYTRGDGRRLFEKASFYHVWALEESVGFHYKVSRTPAS